MKKIFILNLYVMLTIQLIGQTEKGMWLVGGSFLSHSATSTINATIDEDKILSIESETGLFLNKKNLVGVRTLFQFENRTGRSIFTGNFEENPIYQVEFSSFYRLYPFPEKKLGVFGELQGTIIGQSNNSSNFFNQFKTHIGAGAYFFIRKNLAFEMSLSRQFYSSIVQNGKSELIVNFSLLRNFKRPAKTYLPRLEDAYLFVRNFYYGLGIQRHYNQVPFSAKPQYKISVNTGIFIGSRWLLDIEYAFEDFNSSRSPRSFGEFRLESSFFVPLNKKGTYLRPSVGYRLETGLSLRRANPDLEFGDSKFAYLGHLEIAQFVGDQFIFRGGTSFIVTKYGRIADYYLLNATLRMTYFINEDIALECVGAYYIHDKFINHTEGDLRLELTRMNAEFKIKHFFFRNNLRIVVRLSLYYRTGTVQLLSKKKANHLMRKSHI